MRSYQDHIKDLSNKKRESFVFRASSLFPVMVSNHIKSRVLFMGYWQVKRGVKELTCILSLRTDTGELLLRKSMLIDSPKAYEVDIAALLEEEKIGTQEFIGSIELEFFSHHNLVFPFPAVVINYYGENFCSFVHTAQRVYSNIEDKNKNSQFQTPESGFTIQCSTTTEPFFAFVNGPIDVEECRLPLEFINSDNASVLYEQILGSLRPYETRFVYPSREYPIKEFLHGGFGTIKLSLNLPWVFPRILCGTVCSRPMGFSLTHSYYDQSTLEASSAYWEPRHSEKFVEALSLPLKLEESFDTFLTFYPIYSPAQFSISLEVYSVEGRLLEKVQDIYQQDVKSSSFERISCKKLLEGRIDLSKASSCRVYLESKGKVPARVKIAFDIEKQGVSLCCNVCTNLQPYIPNFSEKPSTFRWFPFFADQLGATCFIINGTPDKTPHKACKVELNFYRQKDQKTKQKTLVIPPQGCVIFSLDDPDMHFFLNQTGWVTASISNPYATTYSFVFHPSGAVGGDHGF